MSGGVEFSTSFSLTPSVTRSMHFWDMRLRHYDHDGRARFVTFLTHNRHSILVGERQCVSVVNAIARIRSDAGLRVLGYVVMPEHVHAVVLPPLNGCLGNIVGEIKRLSAREILRYLRSIDSPLIRELEVFRNGQKRHVVWKRRCYDRNCRTTAEMWNAVRYCHDNPVRRGLVDSPTDWRWSSYRWYHDLPNIVLEMDEY